MGKNIYNEWLEKDKLYILEHWATEGATDEEIAKKIGIARKTLYQWKIKYSSIGNALKKGKEVIDFQVEDSLLKNALAGNVVAQIFWLKNRRPDKWRDKREVETDDTIINNVGNILVKIKEAAKNAKEEE